jgi:peptidoglycan/LPS O-acetylase OafA/YrhL
MHYAILDGLRGIAALAVLVYHYFVFQSNPELPNPIPYAWLAVDFFFLLSGFVIASAYEARLCASMTFVDFVKIRFVRLYPMILAGVLLGACHMPYY